MLMFAQSRPAFVRLLFVILTIAFIARPAAAEDETSPLPVDNDPLVHVTEPQSDLRLVEKFAKIIELKNRITTVYGFDPEVVNVTKVDMHPNEIRVHALTPGVTSLVLVDEKNKSFTIEVFVIGDVRHLQAYLKNLFPNDAVTAVAVRESVVLRGYVSVPENIPRIIDIAKEFYPNVINQMEVGGDQEIQLKVRVVEIDRTKLRQLGFNFNGMTNNAFLAGLPGGHRAAFDPDDAASAAAPALAVNPTKFTTTPLADRRRREQQLLAHHVPQCPGVGIAAQDSRQSRVDDDQRHARQLAVRRRIPHPRAAKPGDRHGPMEGIRRPADGRPPSLGQRPRPPQPSAGGQPEGPLQLRHDQRPDRSRPDDSPRQHVGRDAVRRNVHAGRPDRGAGHATDDTRCPGSANCRTSVRCSARVSLPIDRDGARDPGHAGARRRHDRLPGSAGRSRHVHRPADRPRAVRIRPDRGSQLRRPLRELRQRQWGLSAADHRLRLVARRPDRC